MEKQKWSLCLEKQETKMVFNGETKMVFTPGETRNKNGLYAWRNKNCLLA